MAKAKQMLYTKEGFEALVAELKERQTVKREEIKKKAYFSLVEEEA